MDILSPPPGAWLTLQAASVDRMINVTTTPDTARPIRWGLAGIPLRITSSSLHVRRYYSRRFPLPGTILQTRPRISQRGAAAEAGRTGLLAMCTTPSCAKTVRNACASPLGPVLRSVPYAANQRRITLARTDPFCHTAGAGSPDG